MICDRIAILYSGSIIESGLKDEIMNNPKTEIGKLLLKDGEYKWLIIWVYLIFSKK